MEARQQYEIELELAQKKIQQTSDRLSMLVRLRTALFAVAALGFLFGYGGGVATSLTIPLGWLGSVAFFVAIVWNEQVRLAHLRMLNDQRLFQRLLARIDRNFQDLPAVEFLDELPVPDCDEDLDIGLLALVNLTNTHPGLRCLQNWIATACDWSEVQHRQAAVQSMVPLRELRIELIRRVANTNFAAKKPYGLAEWAQQPSWLKRHPIAHALSYIGPFILLTGAALFIVGQMTESQFLLRLGLGGLTGGAVMNILITTFWGSWIHEIFHRICGEHHASSQFWEIFKLFRQLPDDQGILSKSKTLVVEPVNGALQGFKDLSWLVRLASLQRNVVFYLIYLVLQLILLWDFRILKLLERWQSRYGASTGLWFEALGQVESVISAATLTDENPDWCFPEPLSDEQLRIKVVKMGHPLLAANRVCNDVTLTDKHPLLLVTGSNMAGKSTLMRALGVNLLLARLGSKVCAESMATPLYEIASSIRVRDNLNQGVSFFMAELKRLKSVVDQANAHQALKRPLLFLLDEILQGTNSQERQIAVAHVVSQLIGCGATGLLSTHDLDLAQVESVSRVAQVVHFREYFEADENGQQRMRFDYIMRPGPTPTTNALKLLELVGLK